MNNECTESIITLKKKDIIRVQLDLNLKFTAMKQNIRNL